MAADVTNGEPATQFGESGYFRMTLQSALAPVAINRMHNWTLRLETPSGDPVSGANVTVTGGMPDHDHGLPTAPRATGTLNDGQYLIEGVKFHMNGRWELTIGVETATQSDAATFEFAL